MTLNVGISNTALQLTGVFLGHLVIYLTEDTVLLLLASVDLLGSSGLLLTAPDAPGVLLTMLSLCSGWLGPGLGRGGALLELVTAALLVLGVEDTRGFSVLTPGSRLQNTRLL